MKKTLLLLALVALSFAAIPAFAGTTCPSYGSYANLCSGAYDLFGGPRSTADCAACCAEHAQETICDCTDPVSLASCDKKVNTLEADCYGKCDAVIACAPSDLYCGFSPVAPPPGDQP